MADVMLMFSSASASPFSLSYPIQSLYFFRVTGGIKLTNKIKEGYWHINCSKMTSFEKEVENLSFP